MGLWAVLTVLWNVYVIGAQIFDIHHGYLLSPTAAVLFSFPAVVAAGIAIKRCFIPSLESAWRKWGLGA